MDAAFWSTLWHNLMDFGSPDSAAHPVTIIEKIARPIVVYVVLVVGLRLWGRRVLAQLNPFDFVVLLTLSNTVQNAIIGNDTSLSGGLIGAVTLFGVNAALVRAFYRGPQRATVGDQGGDTVLIKDGQYQTDQLNRLHVNSAQIMAKAHERGFDGIEDIESAVLSPSGSMYFHGRRSGGDDARHEELLKALADLKRQIGDLAASR